MASHFLFDAALPAHGRLTRVAWSFEPTGCALVFVHGFNGSAFGTWSSFSTQLRQHPKFSGWDIFFYGYDGLHTEAVSSAAELGGFLDAMNNPKDLYLASDASPVSKRVHPQKYDRIILVAHSLGAVVSRRAMLDGYNRATPALWSSRVQLFNFAPAHNGAKIIALLAQSIGPLMAVVPIAQLFNLFIVLRDLHEDSKTLKSLAEECVQRLEVGASNMRALAVVLAKNDRVVNNGHFVGDPAPDPVAVIAGQTHSSVCKPSDNFQLPVELLAKRI